MNSTRPVRQATSSRSTLEGAGVHLRRAFGTAREARLFDPFLLLDDFRSARRADFINGFPWHPHRGIETITYVLNGKVEHGDSLGNNGVIDSGDVQWMTAGRGIIHQEMPKGDAGGCMEGFQLWANLPASDKMMKPRYRDITADSIPEVLLENGTRIRVICGNVHGTEGPVTDIVTNPEYLDVYMPAETEFDHPVPAGHTAFAYVFEGSAWFGPDDGAESYANHTLILFGDGSNLHFKTGPEHVRLLLVSGRPLREPIAWYGPIVMNTQEELDTAFREYENGTFIRDNS